MRTVIVYGVTAWKISEKDHGKSPKMDENENPFLRLENTKKALFCPFLYFKVPKRTKKPHPWRRGEADSRLADIFCKTG